MWATANLPRNMLFELGDVDMEQDEMDLNRRNQKRPPSADQKLKCCLRQSKDCVPGLQISVAMNSICAIGLIHFQMSLLQENPICLYLSGNMRTTSPVFHNGNILMWNYRKESLQDDRLCRVSSRHDSMGQQQD